MRKRSESAADQSEAKEAEKSEELKAAEHAVYEQIVEKEFDAADQEVMCLNEHERFRPSSTKVAHALVYTTDQGTFAKQYDPPITGKVSGTQIRPVIDLEIINKSYGSNHGTFIRANTPNGTEMIGKRKLQVITTDLDDGEVTQDLWRLSPTNENLWKGEYFFGVCADHIPLFRSDLPKDNLKELQKEQDALPTVIKHKQWQVDSESVLARSLNPKRGRDQNTVMGHSAFDEVEAFYDQHTDPKDQDSDELHPERKEIFKKNAAAKHQWRGGSVVSQHRHEWLHLEGHSLAPSDYDSQTADNLAAGPKWMNSEMMVNGERAAKWVALHMPGTKIDGECEFELIKGSEIIEKGNMRFTFDNGDKKVELRHPMNPWRKFVSMPKPSDNAQTTLVVSKLLSNKEADRIEPVTVAKGVNYMTKPSSGSKDQSTNKASTVVATTTTTSSHSSSALPTTPLYTSGLDINSNQSIFAQIKSLRSSIVKICTSGHIPKYTQPWRSSDLMEWHGSGCVFEWNNRLLILSNAHVVENNLDIRVRLANDHNEYVAKVFNVGYQCDLAILEVDDKEFLSKAKPLSIGEMVTEGQHVSVLGFPMGGDELSFTNGPVSRIQIYDYSISNEVNLQVQTQTPTNPGNSGGPVMSNGKIVGIAFQGDHGGEGLNYFIPVPVIRHFLEDSFSPRGYQGFPDLAMNLQEVTGPVMRSHYGLSDGQSGVRIQRIDPLSSANGILQIDDIITAIDGVSVSHDAKVNIPGIAERLDLNYMFLRKHIGEDVKISVLRKNSVTKELERKVFRVKLKERPAQTKKLGPPEFDKSPTYFFHSGLLFMPLTPNFLQEQDGLKFRSIRSQQDEMMNEIPCKEPGEQFVIINKVLKCDSTFGSHEFEQVVVKKINGREIKNLNDAIIALRTPENGMHVILVEDDYKVVVKNLSVKENLALLKHNKVEKSCSDDLLDKFIKVTPAQEVVNSEADDERYASNTHSEVKSEGEETLGSESEEELCSDSEESDLSGFIDHSVMQPRSAMHEANSKPLTAHTKGMAGFANTINRAEAMYTKALEPEHHPKKRRVIVESSEDEEEEIKVVSRRHKHRG